MPIVGISTSGLRQRLGTELTGERIAEAVDQLGCDLEELAQVDLYTCPACGITSDRLPREDPPSECDVCGHAADEAFEKTGADERIRLDLLPARPDLFNAPGLSRALLGYLDLVTGLP
jgi:phenylalanyl-tRNA synthetase beta chain